MIATDFTARLMSFSEETIAWCVSESEASTLRVSESIDMLLKNAARVSRLSAAGEAAVRALQTELTQKKPVTGASPSLVRLKKLVIDNAEMREMINPMIEVLQFQDAFRQQLENVVKVMRFWQAEREKVTKTQAFAARERAACGEALAKLMTMRSERDVVRKVFPEANLPEEKATAVEFF